MGGNLTFDEFGAVPLIDVNCFTPRVTFSFAPGQAFYNQSVRISGNALMSVDPVLTGPTTGVLTLAFDYESTVLQFDILLLSISNHRRLQPRSERRIQFALQRFDL
jgi:hypothetical protein